MKIKLIAVGKTDSSAIEGLYNEYIKRLSRMGDFSLEIIPDVKNTKNLSQVEQKTREGEAILSSVSSTDIVILLDERGREYTSMEFAAYLQKHMNSGIRTLCFVIGGPYGFSDAVYNRANGKISLSRMTFSHQMIRLFFIEQIYRAHTIMAGLPYHHQ
ncbi:MAG: 23S rRNA (pseudouridine(1915)-N(3))-methyltransferase RlmH [Flavobacteriales bacterium]|jgi:23S rRNA (pseudouridine1915-N3)-methyltransferase|nr:23S rRNA (pseudouridine(1915)-N(3))-methyltransferase RlmH [Flavobacteriales bacterium]MBQ2421624.1 23S rRNA (pseudouridine(1915)-N(3))-methyltransferase RlmH [Flavobacteriales bacterium]MBQ5814553.1 23S rRNA (pseudouridine(1915)-N(3))-methyltransferase RlmH [Flavobacteriales bacterium]MBR4403336.1 23S rRNA (pseudouridine(1915)-N(3))-methyltransferase RlmH [Flavobacteriales bacterium]